MQGNATMILLKGNDKESILAARTCIHKKFLENDKNKQKNELWIRDIMKLQKQLDVLVKEVDNIQVSSTCNSPEELKERVVIIEKILKLNESLAKLLI